MSQYVDIDVERITFDPEQPRSSLRDRELTDETKLAELAASITKHGLIEPVVVRESGEQFILIAGERRWRAARMAGLTAVPAIVRESLTAEQVQEMAIAENTARLDLNPMEEARAFHRLMQRGMTEPDVAATVGKSVSVVKMRVLLLNLDEQIARLVELGQVSISKAEILARVPRNHQFVLIRAILAGTTDEALIVMAEQMLLRENQPELFDEDELPAQSAKARAARKRLDEALETASAALNALLDPATMQLLPQAMAGDKKLIEDRLLALEKDARRLRNAMRAADDAERSGVFR